LNMQTIFKKKFQKKRFFRRFSPFFAAGRAKKR